MAGHTYKIARDWCVPAIVAAEIVGRDLIRVTVVVDPLSSNRSGTTPTAGNFVPTLGTVSVLVPLPPDTIAIERNLEFCDSRHSSIQ